MDKLIHLPVVKRTKTFDSSRMSFEEMGAAIRMIDVLFEELELDDETISRVVPKSTDT